MDRVSIEVTPKAREKLLSLGVGGEHFVRLQVVAGGCSGMRYEASIHSGSHGSDLVAFEDSGIRIVTDPRSMLFLDRVCIDYEDDLVRAGFRISNANAAGSCGCGSSFAPPEGSPVGGHGLTS
jgi:iron-sulfur cluster assembly accessory protein